MSGQTSVYDRAVAEMSLLLSFRRPHDSNTEREFTKKFLDTVPGMTKDGFGNRMITIGHRPRVMWSSHVDTVHHKPGRQTVTLDGKMFRVVTRKSNCLGADCTAGVWLMLEMIRAGKPGLYIFHRGEEVGGLGSQYIAVSTPEVLAGIDIAIALDRMGYSDVITHQFGRCASDAFAYSVCRQLGMGFTPSDRGIFTDTANYADLIPECSNLSVGYFKQHGPNEHQDIEFLVRLRAALLALDTDELVVDRDPAEDTAFAWSYTAFDDERAGQRTVYDTDNNMAIAVQEYPDLAASLLASYGVTLDEFLQHVYDETGRYPI